MKSQKVRTKLSYFYRNAPKIKIGGWFRGKDTYLTITAGDIFCGFIADQKLYRLAKAIIRHYEGDKCLKK